MHLSSQMLLIPLLAVIGTVRVAAEDATSYTDDSTFKQTMLNMTNDARHAHNASSVSWNDTLAEFAENVVGECEFEHSGGPCGENLASGYANVSAAVGVWRDERDSYDYNAAKFSTSTGHFTQLVWKSTTQLGCARSNCTDKGDAPGWFVVCEYSPRGNVEGQFAENVVRQEGATGAGTRRGVGLGVVIGVVGAVSLLVSSGGW